MSASEHESWEVTCARCGRIVDSRRWEAHVCVAFSFDEPVRRERCPTCRIPDLPGTTRPKSFSCRDPWHGDKGWGGA